MAKQSIFSRISTLMKANINALIVAGIVISEFSKRSML